MQDDPGLLAPIERLPRLLLTTATDWQQIGRACAAIAAPSTGKLRVQAADALREIRHDYAEHVGLCPK